MKIFEFRTNIKSSDKEVLKKILNRYKGISKCKIDLNDKDNILHVEGYGVKAETIINAINEAGFLCNELM